MPEWRMTDKGQGGGHYVIDRFEDGGWAVLEVEAGVTFNVPKGWLPEGTEEGDVLQVTLEGGAEESGVRFAVNPVATEERRQSAAELRESLPKAPEGDLEL